MEHYICSGDCGGESNEPRVCEAEFCPKEGQPMIACDCEDGLHKNAGEEKIGDEEAEDL